MFDQKIIRKFVDAPAHIPNMHRATFYHMLCIFYVRFGAFSKVNLALKCTKKYFMHCVINHLCPINHQNIYICICFINAHLKNCRLRYESFAIWFRNRECSSVFRCERQSALGCQQYLFTLENHTTLHSIASKQRDCLVLYHRKINLEQLILPSRQHKIIVLSSPHCII